MTAFCQHINLDAHTGEQMNRTEEERQDHDGHWVIEHIEYGRDGDGFSKPAFCHLRNQVAEVAAVHHAPEHGGQSAGCTNLHGGFEETFVGFKLFESDEAQQEDQKTVACIRQHHAKE